MIVEWKPNLCCGVDSIDEQHKALLGLIATLHEAMAEGRAKAEVAEIVENLLFYTRYHFAWEEQWLDQHRFKGLAAHSADHERLTREVLALQNRLQGGKRVAAMPLMRLFQDWMLSHIDQRDKAAVAAVFENPLQSDLAAPPRAFQHVAD
jgi:hemerythrin-like metal-binding protein